jgi:uncharacterized protein YndB with AHSA1/START domain
MTKPDTSKPNSDKPKFVYVVYIASTAEKVWRALTDPKMTEQYWYGYQVSSDWKVGSRYTTAMAGAPPSTRALSWRATRRGGCPTHGIRNTKA